MSIASINRAPPRARRRHHPASLRPSPGGIGWGALHDLFRACRRHLGLSPSGLGICWCGVIVPSPTSHVDSVADAEALERLQTSSV